MARVDPGRVGRLQQQVPGERRPHGYLTQQIAEQAQVEAAKMLATTRDGNGPAHLAAGMIPGVRNRQYRKRAPGAKVDHLFARSGPDTLLRDFMQQAWYRTPANDINQELRNALSERVPSGGGFLIPEVLRSEVLQMVLEQSVVRKRARVVPMDSLRVPFPTIDETSHVSSVFGGIAAYWTEEAAAMTVSTPAFGRTVLEAKKLTVYTEVPNELLADAAVLTDWMMSQLPAAMAWYEDNAFINGSGTGQPQGFLNAPCAIVTGGGTSGARAGGAGTAVQFSDIVAMYSRLVTSDLHDSPQ
jgi:HK97 family phage major capsid protein